MSYDETLAERVRAILAGRCGVTEKKMFGGLAFLLNGKMCCGVQKGNLVVRVGPERHQSALRMPHARPMDFTGRPLRGFIYVAATGCRGATALRKWVGWGVAFVSGLPGKPGDGRKSRRRAK